MDADAVLMHAPRVHLRRTSDSLILLGTGPAPEVLHGTGVALWDAFAAPARVAEVAAALGEQYDVDPADVARESAPLIDILCRTGLLRQIEP